jgi:hypothetical protein
MTTTIKKYVLHPGHVTSKNDGDRHFISSKQLMWLYGVSPDLCVEYPDMDNPQNRNWRPPDGAIHSRPKYDGNYTLPD